MYHGFHKKRSTTVFNIDNNRNASLSSASVLEWLNEGSCDTEDWSNDAENTGLNFILTYIKIVNRYFKV